MEKERPETGRTVRPRPSVPSAARAHSHHPRPHPSAPIQTYTNAIDFRPGPKLNLIIGPNGAGKSSLVCAICIGLGGAPRLLGRARELREYVRRGAPSGWVEITLGGGPPPARPLVIRRDLSATSSSSDWRMDGAPATATAVAAAVAGAAIRLDNLCQFLPQDRVADLARLPPSALLEETERCLGDASLHALHADLAGAVEEERAARRSAGALRAEAEAGAGRQDENQVATGRQAQPLIRSPGLRLRLDVWPGQRRLL